MEVAYAAAFRSQADIYRHARILVTSVFFMWGLSYGLLEVLNKHFQEILHISKAQSGLLQTAYFGAYFLAALPAAAFMQRTGYKSGLILGLFLYATGAMLFIPASFYGQFEIFLGALFVLACGLACLETASNPYMVALGEQVDAAKRLNLAQSFCGLGCFIGPLLGGMFFFSSGDATSVGTHPPLESIRLIYACLAVVVVLIALFIKYTATLDEPKEGRDSESLPNVGLLTDKSFIYGVAALFFYVAAQVGIGAFFINYVTEHGEGVTSQRGAFLLSIALFTFMMGRFLSTWLMGYIKPRKLLGYYSFANLVLCAAVIAEYGWISVIALITMFFFMSMMFPTIFSLAIKNLGAATKRGASILMMALIGGAISPYLMGHIADHIAIAFSYVVPFTCFIFVLLYSHFLAGEKNGYYE